MSIILCGAEEPIEGHVGEVHAWNPARGISELGEFAVGGVNRYCFVSMDEFRYNWGAHSPAQAALVEWIDAQIGGDRRWLTAVRNDPESFEYRKSQIVLRKNGWQTATNAVVRAAMRSVVPADVGMQPWERTRGLVRTGSCRVLGAAVAPEAWLAERACGTTHSMATRLELAPTRETLAWLRDVDLTLVYELRTYQGQPVLVVVGPRQLEVDSLLERGLIQLVERGTQAPWVWRRARFWQP